MTQPGSEQLFVERYKLLRPIAFSEGNETYEALDMKRQQRVALKIVRTSAMDREAQERIERELHRARGVVHPHVQRLLDVGRHLDEDSGVELPFVATELLEGETLEERLRRRGPLSPEEALPLARQMAEGMAALHDAGLVHGDFRSSRVVLVPTAESTQAVLVEPVWAWDLGVQGHGSSVHLAPERFTDAPPTPLSDIFSFGIVLLEMLAGPQPYPTGSAAAAFLERLRPGAEVSPSPGLGLAPLWEMVIRRCLEPRPQRRFPNAREVVRALTQPMRALRMLDEPSVAIRTVLLLDLIDSTRLVESLGDARAAELFARHDQLARARLRQYGGQEIDKTDGFLFLFERPVDAARYALDYNEQLSLLEREQQVTLKARAGIHLGEVVLRQNPPEMVAQGAKPVEVEGLTKLIAARIMSLAGGCQILLTRAAFDMARRAFVGSPGSGEELEWRAHGFYLLAGVEEPVEVCEVGRPGQAPLTPPADTAKVRRVLLSSPALPSVPAARATHPVRRLPRLLLALGGLSLAALGGYTLRQGPTPPATVTEQVKLRRSVAVLGFRNLSQHAEETAWMSTAFSEMLTAELALGDQLRIVSGDGIDHVRKELAQGETASLTQETLDRLHDQLGVDLVVLGAYMAMPEESGGKLQLILRIQDAASGEGLATLKQMGTQDGILDLVSRMGILLRERLGTNTPEKPGHERSAAQLPANAEALRLYAEGLERQNAFEPLAARELYLQAVKADPHFALAYSALAETWSQLGYETKAREAARQAHALAKGLEREEQLLVEARLHEMEKDWPKAVENYRALTREFPDDLKHGLRLAEAQSQASRGRDALATLATLRLLPPPASQDARLDLAEANVQHSLSNYKRALSLAASAEKKGTAQGARLLVGRARLASCNALLRLGDHREAYARCSEARRTFIEAQDRDSEAQVVNRLANVAYEQGNYEEAHRIFEEARRIWRDIGNQPGEALALQNIADTLLMMGKLAEAEPIFEEALAIEREFSDQRNEGLTLTNLAHLYNLRGEPARAWAPGEEGLRLSQETEYRYAISAGRWTLGNITLAQGRVKEARLLYSDGLALARQTGDHRYTAYNLMGAGDVAVQEGELTRARGHYEEALELRQKLGGRSEVAETQVALGLLAVEEGRAEEGLEPLRAAVDTYYGLGLPDGEAQANIGLALAWLSLKKPALAQEASTRAEKLGSRSQVAQIRLSASVVMARVLTAEGRPADALPRLEKVLDEARRRGLVLMEYEALLALAEAELASGRASAARARLQTLHEDTVALGLTRFVRKTEALGATSPEVKAPR
ncbi:MAG TPA: tetratricopeptide repeat protein [Myxococcaceae bacterium]|nr:tetratricopeptide repeat protein [Myxococcaceae bacterium]